MTNVANLKAGWQRVKFGDVVRLSKARSSDPIADGYDRYIGLEHIEPEDLRIRRWGNVADGVTFTSVFKPGQVLFGKRRAYQRKVAVAEFAGVCSGDIYVLESKDPKELLPELLPFICQTEAFFQHAVGTSAGSLSPRTNWTSLAGFEFALPPLEEQRRITVLLKAIEAERESLIEVEVSAINLACSIGKNILDGNTGFKVKIDELASFASGDGIAVSLLSNTPSDDAKVPVYGGNGIAGYTLSPLQRVPAKTVVIGRVGAYCGKTYFVEGDSWVSDNALFAISISDIVLPRYLALCLAAVNLNRLSTGGAQPLINQQIVKSVKIPIPPIDKQQNFVEAVQSVLLSGKQAIDRANKLKHLKQLVMERGNIVH